jgi:hypothetical protein
MPAYAYPITVHRSRLQVRFEDVKEFDSDFLTLADLQFVGEDSFYVNARDNGGYRITVSRSRLETVEERNSRVAKEESYMTEYLKRHPGKV